MKLTKTQAEWLDRLKSSKKSRLRYGAPGMPERTADALIRLGLVRIEWQPIFLRPGAIGMQSRFVLVVHSEGA